MNETESYVYGEQAAFHPRCTTLFGRSWKLNGPMKYRAPPAHEKRKTRDAVQCSISCVITKTNSLRKQLHGTHCESKKGPDGELSPFL